MTDDIDGPVEGIRADAASQADDVFTAADLVAAGDALAPDQALEDRAVPGIVPSAGATADDGPSTLRLDPVDPQPQEGPARASAAPAAPGDASLLALIDRLGGILERSDLSELEVEAGATTVILRKPVAVAAPAVVSSAGPAADAAPSAPASAAAESPRPAAASGGSAARPSVKAPLTGIWYASPTPGSAPFVEVGRELAVGQVVGLIEAMKLFNEIKSDLAGRVVRVVPDSGTLVKAKQPLIEVEPL
jgi:acetyl-CoA carboxylase biotin carboxyl carrier protein